MIYTVLKSHWLDNPGAGTPRKLDNCTVEKGFSMYQDGPKTAFHRRPSGLQSQWAQMSDEAREKR